MYDTKVIENTVRHHEEFSNINFFVERFMSIIMVQVEFSFLTPSLLDCPCQMPSDEFKNQLRNIKYFLLKGNLDSLSNLCNIQQSSFRKSTTKWYA